MKVVVLGSTGMLGRYVFYYLKKEFSVNSLNRDKFDAALMLSERTLNIMFNSFDIRKNDVIINCIGIIKQRKDISNLEYVRTNAEFPLILADAAKKAGIKVIHITTDCVFNGIEGNYTETSIHNAEDVYGKTKSLGEPNNCTVIRTSIIGEELKSGLSLIEWVKSNANKEVKSNANKEVNGFLNHRWNGITCLQYAKICEKIIHNNLYWSGVKHIYSPTSVTKAELVQMISNVFDLNIKVNLIDAPTKCDRTLSSLHPPMFVIPELLEQLKELRDFYKYLNSGPLYTSASGIR